MKEKKYYEEKDIVNFKVKAIDSTIKNYDNGDFESNKEYIPVKKSYSQCSVCNKYKEIFKIKSHIKHKMKDLINKKYGKRKYLIICKTCSVMEEI